MLDTTATVISFTIMGISFVFASHMLQVFIFLWAMYALVVPFDIWTRVRVERHKKGDDGIRSGEAGIRSGFSSHKLRDGLQEKLSVAVYMLVLAVIIYFVAGIFQVGSDCSLVCITISGILNIFMGLFLLAEGTSVLENLLDFSKLSGRKANPVLILLAKTLGIVYTNLAKRIESSVKDIK